MNGDLFKNDEVDVTCVNEKRSEEMACEEEYARMMETLPGSDARDQAEADFSECIRFMLSIYEARYSHSPTWMLTIRTNEETHGSDKGTLWKIKPRPPKNSGGPAKCGTRFQGFQNAYGLFESAH